MKTRSLPILLFAAATLAACQDNTIETVSEPTVPTTYSASKLDFTYSGHSVSGKQITAYPGEEGHTEFALSGIPINLGMTLGADTIASLAEIPTPGVIPGMPSLTVRTIVCTDGTFEDAAESPYATFKYSGRWLKNRLSFAVTDVVMKYTPLAGTSWAPAKDGGILCQWDAEPLTFGTTQLTPPQFINLLFSEAMGMDLQSALAAKLDSICFASDGTVQVTYNQGDGYKVSAVNAPYGLMQFVEPQEGEILLYVNPAELPVSRSRVVASTSTPASIQNLELSLARTALPMLAKGMPLQYVQQGDSLTIIIPQTATTAIARSLATVMADPAVQQQIAVQLKTKSPETQVLVQTLLPQVVKSLSSTTSLTLGLRLQKI